MLPFKFAFIEEEIFWWNLADYAIDIFFLADIIMTFFVPFFDKTKFVTNHWLIAKNYVKSAWFWIDVLSILPFDFLFPETQDYSLMLKILKLPRFYKMVFYGWLIYNSSKSQGCSKISKRKNGGK